MVYGTLGKIVKKEHVELYDVFDMVNSFPYSFIEVRNEGLEKLKIEVNKFETFRDMYVFSQDTGKSEYVLNPKDVSEYETQWFKEPDFVLVSCKLKDGTGISLYVWHVTDGIKYEARCRDISLYELEDFMAEIFDEESEWYCKELNVNESHGMNIKICDVKQGLLDEESCKLNIVSANGTTLELDVYDDTINYFYLDENDLCKYLIITPYGQPFTMVTMMFFKKENGQTTDEK
ncbi:MAG: hypothetical protein LUF92_03740 [Clostridiales bacterium]|nr:hypothetical protein [Clostridiales bacterium]